jgi:hypothetical protein
MPQAAIENASPSGSGPMRLPKALIVFLVWTFVGCLSYARYYLRDPHLRLWPDVLVWATCFYPWTLLTPLIFGLEKRFPLGPTRLARNLAVLGLASYGFSYLGFVLSSGLDAVR